MGVTDIILDIKLDNIFANYGRDGQRFSDIQLGDCGGVVPETSKFARESHLIGAGISRSPEVIFEIGWGTPTDIWSFGNAVRPAQARLSSSECPQRACPLTCRADHQPHIWRKLPHVQPGKRGRRHR